MLDTGGGFHAKNFRVLLLNKNNKRKLALLQLYITDRNLLNVNAYVRFSAISCVRPMAVGVGHVTTARGHSRGHSV